MYECVYISIGYLNHKGKQERVRVTYTLRFLIRYIFSACSLLSNKGMAITSLACIIRMSAWQSVGTEWRDVRDPHIAPPRKNFIYCRVYLA